MKFILKKVPLLLISTALSFGAMAQSPAATNVPLTSLNSFRNAGNDWKLYSWTSMDPQRPGKIKVKPGTGILVNTKNETTLVMESQPGDSEIEFDFMISKNSRPSVFVQGYEIKLTDSHLKQVPAFSDMAGIVLSAQTGPKGFPASMNAAKAPGLWQHLKIRFRAPRFDASGAKIAGARFEDITLNGVLVHAQTELPDIGKTNAGLAFKGEAGPVAFRNVSYRQLPQAQPSPSSGRYRPATNPISLDPTDSPYILRSFLNFNSGKRTHAVSVGSPGGINYSYDLKQGTLLQVWRGQFLNMTDMWHERGEPQTAKPLGSVILLSEEPALAVLSDPSATWPAAIPFDDFANKGYSLDANGLPTFRYRLGTADIADKMEPDANSGGLRRSISIENAPANMYMVIARSKLIEALGKGLYSVNNSEYFIRIPKKTKPILRATASGQELIIPTARQSSQVSYSIIW
ncbi:family 16 glycoside hydrolase [Paradesertivirga mongoliensis]|uniref:Family 16 glycoside hydrolase n=1 Tax=Paradesertivirga mongoliensis TaxID=2100740 RepID=A0ABW4ZLW6_9SPHI|nr:family 16 glycoside hydrolase [Pedobacter mongoliensis]